MTTNEQDIRALTYLAGRLRAETTGAGKWDENGTHAIIAKLAGQNLASVVERVTRHAADPGARTPGAIERPFTPPAAGDRPKWEPERGPWCGICGKPEHLANDHEFERPVDRKRDPDTIRQIVQATKAELAT